MIDFLNYTFSSIRHADEICLLKFKRNAKRNVNDINKKVTNYSIACQKALISTKQFKLEFKPYPPHHKFRIGMEEWVKKVKLRAELGKPPIGSGRAAAIEE